MYEHKTFELYCALLKTFTYSFCGILAAIYHFRLQKILFEWMKKGLRQIPCPVPFHNLNMTIDIPGIKVLRFILALG